jgi:hypothetical protein
MARIIVFIIFGGRGPDHFMATVAVNRQVWTAAITAGR